MEKLFEKLNIKPKNKKLFVFVGRLDDDAKKVGKAIRLMKELKDCVLWLVGDGPAKEQYETLVEKEKLTTRVKFLGRQKNPYPYMKKADYLIMTSDYEGFPVTYLEAITLELPIITTIDVSDDKLNIGKDYAFIISKDEKEMLKQVKEIIKENKKANKIDIEKLQATRMKDFEKLFDGVI